MYVINYSGGTIPVNVGTSDTTTSLTLVGRNWTSANAQQGYGQAINQNYVSLLENFAANTTGPAAATLVKGQLWYDAANTTLNYNTLNGAANWVPLLSASSQLTSIGNGTQSNVSVPIANGNILMTVAGNTSMTVTATGVQMANITTGAAATPGTITGNWTLSTGSKLQSTYADLAEYYAIDKGARAGVVVEFGGPAEIRVCNTDMSPKVAGVVSSNPAYVMNDRMASLYPQELVALQGRVPVNVVGTVKKGDLMVSAGNGCARSEQSPIIGSVIGKSLVDKDTEHLEVIEVAVGRL